MVAIGDWVGDGNTFVYGVPRRVRTQYVETFLSLGWVLRRAAGAAPRHRRAGGGPRRGAAVGGGALAGAPRPHRDQREPWLPHPLLAGVKRLRVAADDGLESQVSRARAVAGAARRRRCSPSAGARASSCCWRARTSPRTAASRWATTSSSGPTSPRAADLLRRVPPPAARPDRPGAALRRRPDRPPAPAGGRGAGPGARPPAGRGAAAVGRAAPVAGRVTSPSSPSSTPPPAPSPSSAPSCTRGCGGRCSTRMGISVKLDDPEVARRPEQRTKVGAERYLALARRAQEAAAASVTPEQYARLSPRLRAPPARARVLTDEGGLPTQRSSAWSWRPSPRPWPSCPGGAGAGAGAGGERRPHLRGRVRLDRPRVPGHGRGDRVCEPGLVRPVLLAADGARRFRAVRRRRRLRLGAQPGEKRKPR
jgi:hypothetical protein